MSNIPSGVNCSKCKMPGKQVKDYGRVAAMQCPKCGNEWSRLKTGGKSS